MFLLVQNVVSKWVQKHEKVVVAKNPVLGQREVSKMTFPGSEEIPENDSFS